MPPETRTYLPGIPAYVVLRGSDGICFANDEDYQYFVDVLGQACTRFEVQLHAYCLLADRVHLLLTQERERFGIDEVLRYVDARFVERVQRTRGGPRPFSGPHQVTLIDADRYLLNCYLLIETLPVRERLCRSEEEYHWSSYGYHADGKRNSRISDHYLYLALAPDAAARQDRYRDLIRKPVAEADLRQIREALVFGEPLGDARFRVQIKKAQARRSNPAFVPSLIGMASGSHDLRN